MAKQKTEVTAPEETAETIPAEQSKYKGISQTAKPQKEGQYSAAELSDAARTLFGTTPEVVGAALKTAGRTSATLTEAKRIIAQFRVREVE